ncbi:MAG: helix-turn-helix domain-containing protein [Oscillospiraceae bacterium]
MYKVMLAVKSKELLKEITALHIWGEATGFEIAAVENGVLSVCGGLDKQMYDLLIAEVLPSDISTFSSLKRIRAEGLCRRIALCGEKGDFQSAREGMIIGAYDYFVRPFETSRFISLFARIKNEINGSMAADIYYIEELAELFENRSPLIGEYIDSIIDSESFTGIIGKAAEMVLERFEWLDLYMTEDVLMERSADKNALKQDFLSVFELYCRLCPPHNEKIHNVVNYILFNPESDLRQKTLSEKLFINSSYLSTMFTAQAEIRFVDYITAVKLHRAAWLLKKTDIKVVDIANRLDYKDIGYFSRQFKKLFGLTPSEYRIPDNYNFEI